MYDAQAMAPCVLTCNRNLGSRTGVQWGSIVTSMLHAHVPYAVFVGSVASRPDRNRVLPPHLGFACDVAYDTYHVPICVFSPPIVFSKTTPGGHTVCLFVEYGLAVVRSVRVSSGGTVASADTIYEAAPPSTVSSRFNFDSTPSLIQAEKSGCYGHRMGEETT